MKVFFVFIAYLCCILVCISLYSSCKKSSSLPSTSCSPKYTSDIQPIIQSKCTLSGCHGFNSSLPDLRLYSVVKTNADNGRVYTDVFDLKIMPPPVSGQLSGQEKETLKCWLDNGAPQN